MMEVLDAMDIKQIVEIELKKNSPYLDHLELKVEVSKMINGLYKVEIT